MKHFKTAENKKISRFLIGMLLIIIALPLAIKLVQQNQENRSNAASLPSCNSSKIGKTSCSASGVSVVKCTLTGGSYNSASGSYVNTYAWKHYKSCDCGCSRGVCISKKTFYYYNSSSNKCVSAKYCSLAKCKSAKKTACYDKKDSCEIFNIEKIKSIDPGKPNIEEWYDETTSH